MVFLVAPALPGVPDWLDGTVGTLLLFALVLAVAPIGDAVPAALLLAAGTALLSGALIAAGAGAAAAVPQAALCACAGALFARGMSVPVLVLTLPLIVAVVDAASVFSGAAPISVGTGGPELLSLQVPAWGGGTALTIGAADPVFAAVFWTWAHRYGLREQATALALLAAAGAGVAIALAAGPDVKVPILPLLAAAFYLPNLDRLAALARRGEPVP